MATDMSGGPGAFRRLMNKVATWSEALDYSVYYRAENPMRHFDGIILLAAKRHGSDALKRSLEETRPLSPSEIAATPDHRILAAMTRCVFCAGFSSSSRTPICPRV